MAVWLTFGLTGVRSAAALPRASPPPLPTLPDRLLPRQDSLGGNCKCAILVTVRGEQENLEEAINTLRFAQRAAAITVSVVSNADARVNARPKAAKLAEELEVRARRRWGETRARARWGRVAEGGLVPGLRTERRMARPDLLSPPSSRPVSAQMAKQAMGNFETQLSNAEGDRANLLAEVQSLMDQVGASNQSAHPMPHPVPAPLPAPSPPTP